VRPLDGIKVIEICTVASGPYCAMLLADMGADVIKIEHPQGGDTMRQWPPITEGFSENFASVNRNKRSVALDLKSLDGKARARELMIGADVVLENNRPGVMARLGLDFLTLSPANPKLIYCSISAFGQDGPRASEAGFDLTVQAMSGIMSVTGEPDGVPVKCGVPVSDFATGLYGAFAIAAALRQVTSTGKGMHIDASMFGASLAIAALQTSEYFGTNIDPRRLGSVHPRNAPYQAFRAKDGYFAMAAGNDSLWRSACKAVEREDLVDDSRFNTTSLRAKNQIALREIWEGELARATCAEWLDRFRAAGVACAPINTFGEALADPQVTHMGWIESIELPGGQNVRTFGSPLRFDGQGFSIYRRPPALGEHNDEIFGASSCDEAAE
jgi:crotonobetainyl-CoA:carnitine CoA-transferase CaiB-like acyl-CoA transferase